MKKNQILPMVLLSAGLLFGIGKSISFSDNSKNEHVTPENLGEVLKQESTNLPSGKSVKSAFYATPASVTWPLIDDITTHSLEGNLESTLSYPSATFKYKREAKVDFTEPFNSTNDDNIDFYEYTGSDTNSWSDVNPNDVKKYVQFSVKAKNNGTFTIDKLDALVGCAGTSSMFYQVLYSTNSDFSSPTVLQGEKVVARYNAEILSITFPSSVVITGAETFYIRFYPYVKSATTGKQFALRNVKISGTMEGSVANLPTVATTSVSSISTLSAISGGNISSNGGGAISESGVVYGTNENPTISDSKTNENATSGSYVSNLTGLTPNTTYYVRSYATNAAGTAYGDQKSFTTLSSIVSPTVTTVSQSQVTNMAFTISGSVTEWGGAAVTERGIVYSKDITSPTLDNATKVVSGSGLGNFSATAVGLTPQTLYYAKAYAINSAGVSYGSTATVTTKATDPDVTKVISKDGTGDYLTLQEAFAAVPTNYTGKWIINIKPGTYNERATLDQNKNNVQLIGEDALTTIITYELSAGTINPATNSAWGTSNSQTVAIHGNDFIARNITIENTFKNTNVAAAINSGTQAVALKTQGDRQAFYNCRIVGYQDTYLGNSIGRAYFKNCYIEGNVDFIFGRQTVVFDNCTTYINRNDSVITAPSTETSSKYGMVFLDCNLTVPEAGTLDFNGNVISTMYYGRAWQNYPKSAFIRCNVPGMLNQAGWRSPINSVTGVEFVEYNNTGDGATPEKLLLRQNGGRVLTYSEYKGFYISNIFKKETDAAFTIDWMPEDAVDVIPPDIPVLGVSDIKKNVASIYPNPVTNNFKIDLTLKSNSKVNIAIYEINGRLVSEIQQNGKSGNNIFDIDASKLKSGVYIYKIVSAEGELSGKLIKN